MSDSATPAVLDNVHTMLDRTLQVRMCHLVISFALFLDWLLGRVYGKNLLTFPWHVGSQDDSITIGEVIIFFALFSIFMSMAAPVSRRIVETVLMACNVNILAWKLTGRFKDSNRPFVVRSGRHAPVSDVRTHAIETRTAWL